MRIALALLVLASGAFAQTFDVASVKQSAHPVGKDARGVIATTPVRMSARNVSLKSLVVEAYHVQPFQVTGGPGWLDLDEFDIDARSGDASTHAQLDAMLRALLAERFHLALHRESKEMRVYALTVGKGGPNLHAAKDGAELPASTGPQNFHGDMQQFSNLLSIQLSIPTVDDPTRPAIASGPPAPVVDRTGLAGNYDISVELPHDAGGDSFTRWQRALEEQLGLKLESEKAPVEILVIDRVERVPTGN